MGAYDADNRFASCFWKVAILIIIIFRFVFRDPPKFEAYRQPQYQHHQSAAAAFSSSGRPGSASSGGRGSSARLFGDDSDVEDRRAARPAPDMRR